MQHSYDYEKGNMKPDIDARYILPKANRPQEQRAVINENRARKIEQLPLRKTYGGIKINY